MKKLFGISIILLLFGTAAHANALLTCKDSTGHEVFQGYIGTDKPMENARITREQEVVFTFAVAQKPAIGIDRATFTRKTGIDLKACMGPYVKIYEKQEAGKIRCAAGRLKGLELSETEDAQIFEAIGLPKVEAVCSVIFAKEKMLGLPASN